MRIVALLPKRSGSERLYANMKEAGGFSFFFIFTPPPRFESFLSVWAKYLGELLAHISPTRALSACVSSITRYAKARHNMRQEQTTQPAAIGCLVGLLRVKVSYGPEN